jgi:hypothetical protein
MTNEEMIAWASRGGELDLEKLIWIARNQERAQVWDYVRRLGEHECDVSRLESYPQAGKNKKVAPHEH